MQRGVAIGQSLLVHTLVVVVAWFGLPHLSRDLAIDQPVLTVDVVNTVPETNLDEGIEAALDAAENTPPPEQESRPAPEEAPPPPPPPPAPSEAKVEAVPIPKPDAVPDKPTEKPKSEPVKKVANLAAPPKRPTRKSPDFKRKQQQAALTSKLQDLTQRKQQQRRQEEEKERQIKKDETKEKIEQLVGQALNTPKRDSGALGVSVMDRLRDHINKFWNPPSGAAGADALIVDIIIRLNTKAEVTHVEVRDGGRVGRDAAFRAAASAARRAVLEASPLPLPLDNHEAWKEIIFRFDPRFITRRPAE